MPGFLTLFSLRVLSLSTTVSFCQGKSTHKFVAFNAVVHCLVPRPSAWHLAERCASARSSCAQISKSTRDFLLSCKESIYRCRAMGWEVFKVPFSVRLIFLTAFQMVDRYIYIRTLKTERQNPEVMWCDISKPHTALPCLPTQLICAALYQKTGKRCNIGESFMCLHFTQSWNYSCLGGEGVSPFVI